ncbi:branched-chain amino acid transport system ATP-binding protein [Aquamicrobium terrae]
MTSLVLENVFSGYGSIDVLRGVSLKVGNGDFLAVVGPNGAGKSTLLRTISGLLRLKKGSIRLDAQSIDGLATERIARSGVAYVPEGRGIFTSLTVHENLLLGLQAARRSAPVSEVPMAFDLFPVLGQRRNEWAGNLSGGEQQMLSIARALMARPNILMVDEPSLGLAPRIVEHVYATLTQLREREGIGILVIEQSLDRASAAADRVMLMSRGVLSALDTSTAVAGKQGMAEAYFGITELGRQP